MQDDGALLPIANALRAGHPARAEHLAREHLASAPGHESALNLLGISLHIQGRNREAAEIYRELTERYPGNREYWSNFATIVRECGYLDEAEAAYRQALLLGPVDAVLSFNIGLLMMQRGETPASRDFLMQAHRLDPDSPEICIYAASANFECGDVGVAQRLLEGWREWRNLEPRLWLDFGWILGLLGHSEAAEGHLRRAQELEHDRLHAQARLAMLFERSNRLDEARAMLADLPAAQDVKEAGLRNDILSAQAAVWSRDASAAGLPDRLALLLHAQPAAAVRVNLLFTLARAHHRGGDVAAAMTALQEAHAIQFDAAAKLEPELADGSIEPLSRVARDVDVQRFRAWPAHLAPAARDSPIFVVGFPRSGTTMLEQMLDAHPLLCSMDERAFLQDLIDRMAEWGVPYPDGLAALTQSQCDALRALYWRLVAGTGRWKSGVRLVDKNPLNLLRLPIIMRLFPEASVVLALRHPCDVVLSCYMQNFRSPAFALMCASMEGLARGYVNAMRFWNSHAQLMQPRALAMRYEDLLEDFACHARRLAEFLGLDDASPMENFHEHASRKRFISTPSYAQVVRPPNKDAVGRWRAYGRWLEPALPVLQPMIAHWGYDE